MLSSWSWKPMFKASFLKEFQFFLALLLTLPQMSRFTFLCPLSVLPLLMGASHSRHRLSPVERAGGPCKWLRSQGKCSWGRPIPCILAA